MKNAARKINFIVSGTILLLLTIGCGQNKNDRFIIKNNIDYCVSQAERTLELIPDDGVSIPRSVAKNNTGWRFVDYKDWTSGFWPGILWYLYEYTGDNKWKDEAEKYSHYLIPLSQQKVSDHDLGFQIFNSIGKGYRLTGNPEYRNIVLKTADTLATLYNPKVGTLLSWPRYVPGIEWPQHNTIIDNMMNLEILFWAARNGGNKELYDIAVRHAEVTMKNHFRQDYTAYHIVIYDTLSGKVIKKVTHQGFNDFSMWARGQAWAVYGFVMVYRETKDPKFLEFAEKITRVYLNKLPEDFIPYWDFSAWKIPDEPKDASAAAIVASALIELSTYIKDSRRSDEYLIYAIRMLEELSVNYQSMEKNSSFLLHSTGHWPNNTEVDCSIVYADYYYLEGLIRLNNLLREEQSKQSLLTEIP